VRGNEPDNDYEKSNDCSRNTRPPVHQENSYPTNHQHDETPEPTDITEISHRESQSQSEKNQNRWGNPSTFISYSHCQNFLYGVIELK